MTKTALSLEEVLLEEAERAYTITDRLFHRVTDDDLSWKPATGANWMTVGQLLLHCASFGTGKAIQGFVTGDWGLPDDVTPENLDATEHVPPAAALPTVASVNEAVDLLAADRDLALRCLADVNAGELLARRFAAPWGGPEVSLFQHLLAMIAHLTQHKGQLFYYLKLMGRDVDTSDLWGV